ncbi:MAG: type II secretion system protein [Oligoflexales bacterium]|nr:type II secretion system protein [Oligoflexales bacterium]
MMVFDQFDWALLHPKDQMNPLERPKNNAKGFTLLEVIIVIGLVAFVYGVAIPNFNLKTGNEVASKLGQFAEDIRSAYDYSVLTGRPLRLVFKLYDGEYWLETTKEESSVSHQIKIGNEAIRADPLPEDEKQRMLFFDEDFQRYEDIVGESVPNPETGEEDIPVFSPVIKAKEKLRGPIWEKLDSLEWAGRRIGPFLMVRDLQTTHHQQPVSLEDGPNVVGMIYFLPQGYVEKTVLHVFYQKEKGEVDPDQTPYTILVHPYDGYAEVRVGFEEIDIFSEKDDAF